MVNLDKIKTLAILGNIDSGKTNLAFYYMNSYKGDKNKVLYGYPIKKEGFISVSCLSDLLNIKDSIIFIDEIKKHIRFIETHANHRFMEFISLLSHKNNVLIFTTQISQFITKGVEAFIDAWAFKRIDLETLKNGSRPKRIIQRLASTRKNEWVLDLEQNEYFEYSDKNEIGENAIKTFENQNILKDWRNA